MHNYCFNMIYVESHTDEVQVFSGLITNCNHFLTEIELLSGIESGCINKGIPSIHRLPTHRNVICGTNKFPYE